MRLPDHKLLRVLAANERLRGRVEALRRGSSEFTTLKGADGSVLSAWVMKPPGFDSTHRYPVLFYVYGGPGSQTVNDSWGSGTWPWHLLLTQKGYIVASVDNRGTGLRGRDFRKVVHRQLGVIETRDQAAAASDLATRPWVDPSRIGIWGASYGGFMNLNALFQAPTLYRAAIALAPDEQLKRFKDREGDPLKQWKLTEEDWRNREKWELYQNAAADMIERTSTEIAPWTLVEANDKKFARIKVLKTVVQAIEAKLAG